jgi:hypothetical protein
MRANQTPEAGETPMSTLLHVDGMKAGDSQKLMKLSEITVANGRIAMIVAAIKLTG